MIVFCRIVFLLAIGLNISGCVDEAIDAQINAPPTTGAAVRVKPEEPYRGDAVATCEVTSADGVTPPNGCGDPDPATYATGEEVLGAVGLFGGLAAAADGNFGMASALLNLSNAALQEPDPVAATGASCSPGPRCSAAKTRLERQMSDWKVDMQSAGPGLLAGYQFCGIDATRQVSELCAAEAEEMGDYACANEIKSDLPGLYAARERAMSTGVDVGVDASRTVSCAF